MKEKYVYYNNNIPCTFVYVEAFQLSNSCVVKFLTILGGKIPFVLLHVSVVMYFITNVFLCKRNNYCLDMHCFHGCIICTSVRIFLNMLVIARPDHYLLAGIDQKML